MLIPCLQWRVGDHSLLHGPEDVAQRTIVFGERPGPHADAPALFLDGWSTWVEAQVEVPATESVTVSAWFAPRTFSMGHDDSMVGVVDLLGGAGGFSLGYDPSGRLVALIATVDGEASLLVAPAKLRRGEWNHLALTIDGDTGMAVLYLDSNPVVVEPVRGALGALPHTAFLGRSRRSPKVEGLIPTAIAAGVLGNVDIYAGAASQAELVRMRGGAPLPASVEPERTRYDRDPSRPIYHVSAPQGWMNEPHAPIQVNGTHHLFYQYNPSGPYWARIAWGHLVSHDLVHWEDRQPALETSSTPVAPDGVWSGSSVLGAQGEHVLYFTAGDFSRSPNQAVAIARPTSAADAPGGWSADGRIMVEQPLASPGVAEPVLAGEFRDPFVWREGDEFFMLVGSGFVGRGGAALLYSSLDGDNWQQHTPLFIGDESLFPRTGSMWELPVLLPVGVGADGRSRHALFVAPWWAGPSEHHLQYVWHWIGIWDPDARSFVPDSTQPRHFDGGGHFTGPSGTVLEDGRAVLWSIAQDERSLAEQFRVGWAHNAGLPLELGLHADGALLVRPVMELITLRENTIVEMTDSTPAAASSAVSSIRGRYLEIELEVALGDGALNLEVMRSGGGVESTVIGVDAGERRLKIDRKKSSLDLAHCEAARDVPFAASDTTRLRVFLDGSMIEVYLNERVILTSRAYPTLADAHGLALRLPLEARVMRLGVYELHSAFAASTSMKGNSSC